VSAVTSKPGAPYQVPPEPNRWPSIAMAAGVHAALLAFLWIGVSWQNTEPVSVEAEVWDMKTEAAAPPPPPAPPEEVAPPPLPAPLPAPRVAPPPPPPVEQKVTPKPPDIALEREKQRKLQREEERKERVERELAEREERKREDLAEKKAREKADKLAEKKERDAAEKLAQKKAQEAERKARELADKQADKKEAEKLAAADKKKAADKLAKAKAAADDKQMKALRDAEMARITGAGTNGTAAKSTAPRSDPGYVASITSAIKSRSSYAGDTDMPGNPKVVFRVEQLPTGEIISVRKTKSSGIPEFDRAVENAINKSSPLPKKKDGTVERSLEVGFSMKDLN
jgi:colicin import membrane protein